MWKTTVLRKECFSNVKKTWDRLCCVDIMSKKLCTSVDSAKQPDNKDWFLYLNLSYRLCRLNIRDFCEKQGSSKEPKFELIHDYHPGYPKNTIPTEMEPVIVGSKVYMWGGRSIWDGSEWKPYYKVNLNVYSFDPSSSPPFRLCEGPISRLIPPKCDGVKVFGIEEKIYVLQPEPPLIRVFDLVHQTWKDLPNFPCLPDSKPKVRNQFFCGHKVFISIFNNDTVGRGGGSYIFDTREEKWEHMNDISNFAMEKFRYRSSAIEFKGYLILLTYDEYDEGEDRVIAYKLDSNGIPIMKSYRLLHKITHPGPPYEWSGENYMVKCGDGRMITTKNVFTTHVFILWGLTPIPTFNCGPSLYPHCTHIIWECAHYRCGHCHNCHISRAFVRSFYMGPACHKASPDLTIIQES